MTATTVARAALSAPTRQPPVLPNLLRSEWAKARSVRSTYWSLAAAVAAMIGYGAINSAPHAGAGHGTSDPIFTSLSGVLLAQLAIGILGVLVITTEYSTGMIRSTFAAAPQRHLVIIAKAGVLGAAAFAVGTVASLIAFLDGQAIMGANGVSLTSPGALRSVIGIGLYLGLLGVVELIQALRCGLLALRKHLHRRQSAPGRRLLAHSGLGPLPPASALLLRLAALVEFDKLILTHRDGRDRGFALDHRLRHAAGIQAYGAHRVVIAWNHILDGIRRAVRIDDCDDRHAELFSLVDRNFLMSHVDDE